MPQRGAALSYPLLEKKERISRVRSSRIRYSLLLPGLVYLPVYANHVSFYLETGDSTDRAGDIKAPDRLLPSSALLWHKVFHTPNRRITTRYARLVSS
jgi:hypothetical protein